MSGLEGGEEIQKRLPLHQGAPFARHSIKLGQAYDLLTGAGHETYSLKKDCFVVKAQDEAKARGLFTFDKGVGSWRVGRILNLIVLFEELKVKELCDLFEKHNRNS